MTRVAVLFSGRGSNMAALLDAMRQPGYPAEPALALGNVEAAGGFGVAAVRGVQLV